MQYNAVEEVEEGMSIALPIELQGITMHYNALQLQINVIYVINAMHYNAAEEEGMWGKLLNHNLPTAGLSAALFVFLLCLLIFRICLFSFFVCSISRLFACLPSFSWFFFMVFPHIDIFPCSIKVVKYCCEFGRSSGLVCWRARWDFRSFDEKVSCVIEHIWVLNVRDAAELTFYIRY